MLRALLDMSTTAQIKDSLKLGGEVLGADRQGRPAAQGQRRAGGLRGAEGARHPVDPGRDGLHLEPRAKKRSCATPTTRQQLVDALDDAASSATSRATRRWRGSARCSAARGAREPLNPLPQAARALLRASASRIGQSGRSSPWQQCTRCSSVAFIACSSCSFCSSSCDVRLRQRLHLAARPAPVLPQPEQLADLLDREAEVARMADEAQRVDLRVGVLAIARVGALRLGKEADALVVADHLGRDARRPWPRRRCSSLPSLAPQACGAALGIGRRGSPAAAPAQQQRIGRPR